MAAPPWSSTPQPTATPSDPLAFLRNFQQSIWLFQFSPILIILMAVGGLAWLRPYASLLMGGDGPG